MNDPLKLTKQMLSESVEPLVEARSLDAACKGFERVLDQTAFADAGLSASLEKKGLDSAAIYMIPFLVSDEDENPKAMAQVAEKQLQLIKRKVKSLAPDATRLLKALKTVIAAA